MIRENRYMVFKRADIERYLNHDDQIRLSRIEYDINNKRDNDSRIGFQCVVVEHDWPEYEPTWQAIEQRVDAEEP